MKKTQHKIPRNFVQSPRIDPVIHAQLNSKVDELSLQLADAKQELLNQAKKHNDRVIELKAEIAKKPEPIIAEFVATEIQHYTGFLVENWKSGWKWVSNWAFACIAYVSVFGVPQEVIELLPVATQAKVTAALAVIGFIGRFVNQSKPKPLPPVQGDANV